MDKSYADIIARINRGILELRKAEGDAMGGFATLAKEAMKPGILPAATKELIALAIGVAGRCEGCIGFHTKALARLGTPREAVLETLVIAVYMGGGPSLMHAAEAVQAFDEFKRPAQ